MPTPSLPVVEQTLVRALRRLRLCHPQATRGREKPANTLVIAFSGGPDSTALLAACERTRALHGFESRAVHVDHRADPQSGARARAAAAIASQLARECLVIEGDGDAHQRASLAAHGQGHEAFLRALREQALEDFVARSTDRIAAILTAHHRDDQCETVALRLLRGSGLAGLAGMSEDSHNANDEARAADEAPVRTRRIRPLLSVGRAEILRYLEGSGLEAVSDPTNRDLRQLRARIRYHLLPALRAHDPKTDDRLLALAAAAARTSRLITARLADDLGLEPLQGIGRRVGATLVIAELRRLPPSLWPFALALLQRAAGAPYPGTQGARAELARQLQSGGAIGIDCGGGWTWEHHPGARLAMSRRAPS